MSERRRSPEAATTHSANAHMAERKARTARWWGRAFAGFSTSVLTFAGAVVAAPLFLPAAVGLLIVSEASAAIGGVSAVIGTGSGIVNTVKA